MEAFEALFVPKRGVCFGWIAEIEFGHGSGQSIEWRELPVWINQNPRVLAHRRN
jgi:hypothetical protein